jgi:hypothetical protein
VSSFQGTAEVGKQKRIQRIDVGVVVVRTADMLV